MQAAEGIRFIDLQAIAKVVQIVADSLKRNDQGKHFFCICPRIVGIDRAADTVKGLVFEAGEGLGAEGISQLAGQGRPALQLLLYEGNGGDESAQHNPGRKTVHREFPPLH